MPAITSYTGGIAATNCYLITLSTGTFLVDAPEGAAEWVTGRGAKVDALLLTHQHFDHVQDAAAIKSEHGCPIYAWADFSRELTLERLFSMFTGTSLSIAEFEVDVVLDGRPMVIIQGQPWRLYHVPGHSADSVVFHLEDANCLFSGDTLLQGSTGRTDFPGGSMRRLMTGIRTHLLPLPDETRLFPGHGAETTIGQERQYNPVIAMVEDETD